MKYADIILRVKAGTVVTKDTVKYQVIEYPRLDESDGAMLGPSPTVVMCTLLFSDFQSLAALKQLHKLKSKNRLYVDKTGTNSHYYENVVIELEEDQEEMPGFWTASARFICHTPYLYDATTGQVVY